MTSRSFGRSVVRSFGRSRSRVPVLARLGIVTAASTVPLSSPSSPLSLARVVRGVVVTVTVAVVVAFRPLDLRGAVVVFASVAFSPTVDARCARER